MLLEILHWLGYGICHQIPERTIHLAGQALPLCARCSGIYLGAVVGFAFMLAARRGKTSARPTGPILAVLLGFVVLFAVDGLNSYLSFFPGLPHLYQPQNWLRLTTGALHGLAISFVVLPVFSYTFWQEPGTTPALKNAGDLGAAVAVTAAVVVLSTSGLDALLYPLAIVSSAGLLAMLTLLNAAMLLIALRREARGQVPKDLIFPLSAGLVLGLAEVAVLDAGRLWLTATLGLPF